MDTDGTEAKAVNSRVNDSQNAIAGNEPHSNNGRTFFGQPWGLANLFGVEMWERFSFYGMQGILLYYMYYAVTDGGLGIDRGAATSVMGAYGGLVYMAALVASLVADRLLGSERTLFYSAILVMVGHISLAVIPSVPGLALGLTCIAVGSGGVKTNAQVVLGQLYERTDPRRDAGFSIFYMGVNIGALFGPLLTGWIWGMKGFHWGFGLAAIGMAAGLIQYMLMRNTTIGAAGHEIPNPLPRSQYVRWGAIALATAGGAVVLIGTGIIPLEYLAVLVSALALVAAVVMWLHMYRSPLTTTDEKSRLIGFVPLFMSAVVFFGIFQQQFTVLAIYSDVRLNRNILGFEVSPAWVQAINPLFIIVFAGVFASIWTKLGERQWSTPIKFAIANIVIGISLFFFIPFSGGAENSTPLLAIVWILFLFTLGELLLSPVGNALATKVAPKAFPSTMMAVWLMAIAMGTSLAGTLAGYYHPEDIRAENTFFIVLGSASIVLGLMLLVAHKWIEKRFVDVR
ncbi:peptide MFS transporter [Arcanobacterium bovis]|uniref:Peptide MFS transporter n=1 Tax=Arcanobacterium bovis TaxID=2529275 RepID=A0A4Q9V0D2_9ACTO|nr:peptide MFS transporter [Arcanobacterium bovis]TBW22107.1 peptide MFS transporter [Arcanobacterium bovis]